MMYIHSKLDYKKNLFMHLVCLIPLILYGIYKNGFLLYQKNLINVWDVFKPIYLLLIVLLLYEVISLLRYKKFRLDNDLLSFLIIPMILPPSINYLIFTGGITISIIINELVKDRFLYNKIALGKLIIILLCLIWSLYDYHNLLELNYNYSYNFYDYIFGKEVGGISSTSIFFIIISFIFLSFASVYKKVIPLVSFGIYLLGCLLYTLLINPINITVIFNSNVLFAFVFVLPDAKSSPYTFKKMIIYGIIIGMLTLILSSLINVYEGVYIAIFITSILFNFLNNKKRLAI